MTVERLDLEGFPAVCRTLGSLKCRVAVARSGYYGVGSGGYGQFVACCGHEAVFSVEQGHVVDYGAQSVGIGVAELLNVELHGIARGGNGAGHYPLAVFIAVGFHRAGTVGHVPSQMPVLGHRLSAHVPAVHRQLHLVAVAVYPEVDCLALVSGEIPVRQNVQHWLIGPPSLQIISLVLWEAAVVEDSELRARGRELHRVGLAAIVKARPEETSGKIIARGVEFPAALNAVVETVGTVLAAVVSHHAPRARLVEIHSAGAAARGLLAAVSLALRIVGAMLLHRVLKNIVVSGNVNGHEDIWSAARGGSHRARGIETVAVVAHGGSYALSLLVPLYAPLLVGNAPENHARVVAVAHNHVAELTDVIVVDAGKAVFIDNQNAEAVTNVEHGGSHGVVA